MNDCAGERGEGGRDRRSWGASGICNGVAGSCKEGVDEPMEGVWGRVVWAWRAQGCGLGTSSDGSERPETETRRPARLARSAHRSGFLWWGAWVGEGQ